MSDVHAVANPTSGVVMMEGGRKGLLPFDFEGREKTRDAITERLYVCPNGWKLGARRGGRLHLADSDTWEIFVLTPLGIECGGSVGWVSEETLTRAVARLAAWGDDAA